MTRLNFRVRTILLATCIVALSASIVVYTRPRDARKLADRISRESKPIATDRIFGKYRCGTRGSVYFLNISPDGSYRLDDEGCIGSNGSVTGRWKQTGNIIELDATTGIGHVYSGVHWLLAMDKQDCVILIPNDFAELYFKNGYSSFWSLTKDGDHQKIRTSENTDER